MAKARKEKRKGKSRKNQLKNLIRIKNNNNVIAKIKSEMK